MFSPGARVAVSGTMTRAQQAWQLLGETVREIGILMFVFAPLEGAFSERTIPPAAMAVVLIISTALMAGGILLSTKD